MKLQKFHLWILAAITILFFISCGAAPEGETDEETVSTEAFVMSFISPAENALYSQPDPRLEYSIVETETNVEVPSQQVGITVNDLVDDEVTASLVLEDTRSNQNLPVLQDGLHNIHFEVNNSAGEQVLNITIRFATAGAPVADAGADTAVRPGETVLLSADDSYSNTTTEIFYAWEIISAPEGSNAVLSDPTAPNPVLNTDLEGEYQIQLIVTDKNGGTSEPDVVIVTIYNTAPVANASADQSLAVLGSTITLDGAESFDVDNDTIGYNWSFVTRPGGSAAALSDPASANPSFVGDVAGIYELGLIVTDEFGASSALVSVIVSFYQQEPEPTPNSAPVAFATTGNTTVEVGSTVIVDGSGSSDADGDPLAYTWSIASQPEGSTAVVQTASGVDTSFVPDEAGTYTVSLIVNDGQSYSTPSNVTIEAIVVVPPPPPNVAPVAVAATEETSVTVGQTVTVEGSGSFDDDGDPLTYKWRIASRPEGSSAVVKSTTGVETSFVPDAAGTYVVSLIVNDGQVDSPESDVNFEASIANAAPVAFAATGDTTVNVSDTVYVDGSGSSDENGDPLTYKWSFASLPKGSAAEMQFSGGNENSFVPDLPGTYVVSLVVNDGQLDSNSSNVAIEAIITKESTPIQILTEARGVIDGLADEDFKRGKKRDTLSKKILKVIEKLEEGKIRDAVHKLSSDVIAKTDGCAAREIPDHNDWLVKCKAQGELFPLLFSVLTTLAPDLAKNRGDSDHDHGRHGHHHGHGYGFHCMWHALNDKNSENITVDDLMSCLRKHWKGKKYDHKHKHEYEDYKHEDKNYNLTIQSNG